MKTRPALPFHGLQYRLCEVGPRRIDPRELKDGLAILSSTSTGIVEYCAGIYSDPDLDQGEATKAARYVQTVLAKLESQNSLTTFTRFISLVNDRMSGHTLRRSPDHRKRALTPTIEIPAWDTVVHIERSKVSPVRIWVSFDLDWLYPHDDRLWAFFQNCAQEDTHPIVFARKIAPSTFPLFKALNVFGIQYYAWLSSDRRDETMLDSVDQIGLPPLQKVSLLAAGRSFDLLENAVMGRPHHSMNELSYQAIVSAEVYGLTQPATATLDALIAWSQTTESPIPDSWRIGIARSATPDRMDRIVRTPTRRRTHMDSNKDTTGTDDNIPGFGRKTTKTRVPLHLY